MLCENPRMWWVPLYSCCFPCRGVEGCNIPCLCVQLMIDTKDIDLIEDAVEMANIADCGDRSLCDRNPCRNGALCQEISISEYRCICPEQFTGNVPGSFIWCLEEPFLVPSFVQYLGQELCLYLPNCQTCISVAVVHVIRQEQEKSICHNTRQCTVIHLIHWPYLPVLSGRNCETEINECVTRQPCLNGGTCNVVGGQYVCGCPLGFMGRDCEAGLYPP